MSRVFWDTNLFIYLFEGEGSILKQVTALQSMLARGDQLITSALTVGEILVKPIEQRDDDIARKYVEAIEATALILPFDAKCTTIYAGLRC